MSEALIVILIPVLGRPERVETVIANLHSSCQVGWRAIFLCSLGDQDQIEACLRTGVDTVVVDWSAGPGDFARKINFGYRISTEPFIQIGADDLFFHRGWDEEVLRCHEMTGAGVVGTNDLHNPRVLRGQHATHPFISRSYIEQYGGTFDRSGEIFCELYDHQFVDDELVLTATLRNQWAFAEKAKVEHLHPYFGKSEMDATYEKALRATQADRSLFMRRKKKIERYVRNAWRRR